MFIFTVSPFEPAAIHTITIILLDQNPIYPMSKVYTVTVTIRESLNVIKPENCFIEPFPKFYSCNVPDSFINATQMELSETKLVVSGLAH